MAALGVEKFLQKIAAGQSVPTILLLGEDAYLRDLCRSHLVEAYVPEGAREWGVARFSLAEDSLEAVLAQAQMMPMLAPRQVVFAEDVEALERSGENSRERVAEALTAYLDDPAPFTVLVLEATKLDERTRLFKTLSAKVLVVAVELSARIEERVPLAAMMARRMAKEMRVELERDVADELSESLNGDLSFIRSELEKLATYAGERGRITREDVEALVISARKYSVWQFASMLAARERAQALEFLNSLLREGEQPAGLVGAMAWMYRKLIEAHELPAQLSGWQAARQLGMKPETAELALRQAKRIPRPQLLQGLQALYEADSRLKSGPANPRAVMEFLVARLTGGARPESRSA